LFLENCLRLQYGLVWHVFLELYHGLKFLHAKYDPPIAHKDLHAGTVLLGYNDASERVPNVLIVDFGDAVKDPGLRHIKSDVAEFVMLMQMVKAADGGYGSGTACSDLDVFLGPNPPEGSLDGLYEEFR